MSAVGWSAALANEWLKVRRSRVPLVTFVVLAIGPLAGALFIYIAADPQRAKDLGLLGQKAELSGITADWSGMLMFSTPDRLRGIAAAVLVHRHMAVRS